MVTVPTNVRVCAELKARLKQAKTLHELEINDRINQTAFATMVIKNGLKIIKEKEFCRNEKILGVPCFYVEENGEVTKYKANGQKTINYNKKDKNLKEEIKEATKKCKFMSVSYCILTALCLGLDLDVAF